MMQWWNKWMAPIEAGKTSVGNGSAQNARSAVKVCEDHLRGCWWAKWWTGKLPTQWWKASYTEAEKRDNGGECWGRRRDGQRGRRWSREVVNEQQVPRMKSPSGSNAALIQCFGSDGSLTARVNFRLCSKPEGINTLSSRQMEPYPCRVVGIICFLPWKTHRQWLSPISTPCSYHFAPPLNRAHSRLGVGCPDSCINKAVGWSVRAEWPLRQRFPGSMLQTEGYGIFS